MLPGTLLPAAAGSPLWTQCYVGLGGAGRGEETCVLLSDLALPLHEVIAQAVPEAGGRCRWLGLFSVLDLKYLNVTPADSGFLGVVS